MNSIQQRNKNVLDFNNKEETNLTNFNSSQLNPKRAITMIKHQMAVQKAIEKIKEKIEDTPTLSELASISGLSRTYFSNIFKETTGIKLQEFITQTRLEKAKNLLIDFEQKIKEVAFKTGFKDPNYFCRTFKRKIGLTPTHWRVKIFLNNKNHN